MGSHDEPWSSLVPLRAWDNKWKDLDPQSLFDRENLNGLWNALVIEGEVKREPVNPFHLLEAL